MTENVNKKEMRIFISSTFSDMQEERDELIKTFNWMRGMASERGIFLSVIDLRWGITEEESARGDVIDLCLSQINKPNTYFIGIIGNNYGSVPPKDLILNKNLTEKYPWLIEDIRNGLSYTEIEIQSGVLRNPKKVNAYFYLKESETEKEEDEKLVRLKNLLRNQEKYPVYPYEYPEDIENHLRKVFLNMIDEISPNTEGERFHLIEEKHEVKLKELKAFSIPRLEIMEMVDKFIADPTKKLLILEGEKGMGKSNLCAQIIDEYEKDFDILFYSPGLDSSLKDIYDFLNFLIKDSVSRTYNVRSDNANDKVENGLKGIKLNTLLVVDDADKIDLLNLSEEIKSWLKNLPDKLKIVVSVRNKKFIEQLISKDLVSLANITPLDNEERTLFVKEYLNRVGKKLSGDQILQITDSPLSGKPDVLKGFLDELSDYGHFERLNEKIHNLVSLQSEEDRFLEVLKKLENEYSYEYLKLICRFVFVAYPDISHEGLLELSMVPTVQFYQIIGNGKTLFNDLEERISFTQDIIKKLIRERYFESEEDEEELRRFYVDYLKGLLSSFSIRYAFYSQEKNYFSYIRDYKEVLNLGYNLSIIEDVDLSVDFLANPYFYEVLFRLDPTHLKKLWSLILFSGYDFKNLINKINSHNTDKRFLPIILHEYAQLAEDFNQFDLSELFIEKELEAWKCFGDVIYNIRKQELVEDLARLRRLKG
ncbi:MAG: DUF4062 domain-containing protein [Muribaculaceae bacterium]|nr:DUF4062 domain-containing protein [Muribaculaceae bacterium]